MSIVHGLLTIVKNSFIFLKYVILVAAGQSTARTFSDSDPASKSPASSIRTAGNSTILSGEVSLGSRAAESVSRQMMMSLETVDPTLGLADQLAALLRRRPRSKRRQRKSLAIRDALCSLSAQQH